MSTVGSIVCCKSRSEAQSSVIGGIYGQPEGRTVGCRSVGRLVGRLDGWLVDGSVCWSAAWSEGWWVGRLAGRLVGRLVGWSSVGRHIGNLVGRKVGRSGSWMLVSLMMLDLGPSPVLSLAMSWFLSGLDAVHNRGFPALTYHTYSRPHSRARIGSDRSSLLPLLLPPEISPVHLQGSPPPESLHLPHTPSLRSSAHRRRRSPMAQSSYFDLDPTSPLRHKSLAALSLGRIPTRGRFLGPGYLRRGQGDERKKEAKQKKKKK